MSSNSNIKVLTNGFIKENPVFVLLLGLCPALGTTSTAFDGFGMGLATTFVLVCANVIVSLIKNITPDKVRIPVFIVVAATLTTVVEILMQAYVPALFDSLGVFIPLIAVNCIGLGRSEAFAARNNVGRSFLDGVGVGLGFTFALTLLGAVRELLGTGSVFSFSIFPETFGMLVFVLAPGAFIALGYLIAIINKLTKT
jgi:electron transport complex protein RnfE